MELNHKKLERTSRIVYNLISVILCIFLVLLSGKIIDDLDSAVKSPQIESFENKQVLPKLEHTIKSKNVELESINSKKATIQKTIATAKENYKNEKESFDNWLQTRKTLGSPNKDQAVIERANKLDAFYKIAQEWNAQLNTLQHKIDTIEREKETIQKRIEKENVTSNEKFQKELKWYDLKVFLVRLCFVAPILALGIFFFVRYRRHKFWPLYFGFTLFSLYVFFFGLVPYLPSYGGYVRYIVGIGLSIGLGYYAIKKIRLFIETKQQEMKISTEERAKNVQTEVAEKALENHYCPSCGKDFILKRWEFPTVKDTDAYKLVTSFCRHCGLELFKHCNSCGNKNFAHLPFCASCGAKSSK